MPNSIGTKEYQDGFTSKPARKSTRETRAIVQSGGTSKPSRH